MCLIPVQFSKISALPLPKSAVLIYQVSIYVSITFINFLRKILGKFAQANSNLIHSQDSGLNSSLNKADNTYQCTLY